MTSPIETNNVGELIEATRRAATIGLSSSNKTARKLGDHLNALADVTQSLSDRIDVLEGALAFYADTLCEFGKSNEGCGKYDDGICGGCKARALTKEGIENG